MNLRLVFAGTAFALLPVVVSAQSDHMNMNMDHSSMPAHQAAARTHEATGKIVDIKQDSITLSHGPVASAGWPAMTMSFGLASPELTAGLSKGDTVQFRFTEKDGKHIVTYLAKAQP